MKTSAFRFFVGILLTTLLPACKTTQILRETFSADVVGNQPLKNIPGDPAGDSVSYNSSVLGPRLSIAQLDVTNKPDKKGLVFSEAAISGATAFNQWLSFKGVAVDYTQPIWLSWSAKQRNARGDLLIDIMGAQGLWVGRFYIRQNGQLERVTNVATGSGSDVLGLLDPTKFHSVIISLQPAARKYNITIFGVAGQASVTRQNIAVLNEPNPNAGMLSTGKPSISFRYQNESFSTSPAYIFESVNITRKQP